jgi:starvation-inducible DNA-binding protein
MKAKSKQSRPRPQKAQPILGQRGEGLQPFGTLVNYPIGLDDKTRRASVQALEQILVDTMSLRDMYKKHHWQVTGPTFFQLHLLFDKHFKQQVELTDLLGERIQTLGGVALATPQDVSSCTKVQRAPRGREQVPVQISRLIEAHTLIIREARALARLSAANGDDGTNNLVVSFVIPENEKQVWFLSTHLVDAPLVRATSGNRSRPR